MPETKETNRKYVLFSHTFADMWAGDSADDAPEVTLSYRFAKPTKTQIQRLQDKAARNAGQASRNLVLDCVHPDDKQALTEAMEEYPGLSSTFATAILKGVGFPPTWETSGAGRLRPGRCPDPALAPPSAVGRPGGMGTAGWPGSLDGTTLF